MRKLKRALSFLLCALYPSGLVTWQNVSSDPPFGPHNKNRNQKTSPCWQILGSWCGSQCLSSFYSSTPVDRKSLTQACNHVNNFNCFRIKYTNFDLRQTIRRANHLTSAPFPATFWVQSHTHKSVDLEKYTLKRCAESRRSLRRRYKRECKMGQGAAGRKRASMAL